MTRNISPKYLNMKKLNSELSQIKACILLLGFSSIVIQLQFIKEFFAIFNGNELILAIIFGNWMVLTGLGAYLARIGKRTEFKISFFSNSLLISSAIPFLSFFLLYYLKNQIFQLGVIVSVIQLFIFSFLLLAPYCLFSGFLFVIFSIRYSHLTLTNKVSNTYAIESIGSLIGGLIFSSLIINYCGLYITLSFIFLCSAISTLVFYPDIRRKIRIFIISFLAIAVPVLCLSFNFDKYLNQFVFPDQEIIKMENSPYGSIVETRYRRQINVYNNGYLLFCTNNNIRDEELVHFAIVQHKDPKKILVISGGTPGVFEEIMKYNIDTIIYAEINPAIINLLQGIGTFSDNNKIGFIHSDARKYIRQTPEKFDVVLINLPSPDNFQINRYYSLEFLQLLKLKLNGNAIIRYCLPPTNNYVSTEAAEVNASLYNTLKLEFNHVIIIAGEFNYFIASDAPLSYGISDLIEKKKIDTRYVNHSYLDDKDIESRSNYILSRLGNSLLINTDFIPVAYFKQIIYQLSQFKTNYRIFLILLFLFFCFFVSRLNVITLGIFIGGFTVSSVEILVLFSFQVFFGYIYLVTGIFLAVFMSGIAVGCLPVKKRIFKRELNNFILYQTALAFVVMIFIVCILLFRNYYNTMLINLFSGVILFILGFIMGRLFTSSTKLQNAGIREISAGTYSFDLIGSAL
jgi:spermidine synthase